LKEIKNRCFNLTISGNNLADLAFQGMCSYLREKLEGHIYLSLTQLQQFSSVQENRIKNTKEILGPSHREVHVVEHSSDSSDDESCKVLTAEFVWPSTTKSLTCDVLKLIHKSWQDDIKYMFDVAKCDEIFYELHKGGYIKISHTLPLLEELKWRAYGKWHNFSSHATNDCNVFHWQVQSAINDGRLSLKEIKIDWHLFLINKLHLEKPVVLIQPEQAETTKGKNVVIGGPRPKKDGESTPSRRVVMEKLPKGEETITTTIRGSKMDSHTGKAKGSTSAHNDRKRELTTVDQKPAVGPPPSRSYRCGGPDWAAQHHGQTDPRASQTATRYGQTTRRADQTAPSQNRALRMVKP
jgi:hypothetical protein